MFSISKFYSLRSRLFGGDKAIDLFPLLDKQGVGSFFGSVSGTKIAQIDRFSYAVEIVFRGTGHPASEIREVNVFDRFASIE